MNRAHLSTISIFATFFGLCASCGSSDDKPAATGGAATGSGGVASTSGGRASGGGNSGGAKNGGAGSQEGGAGPQEGGAGPQSGGSVSAGGAGGADGGAAGGPSTNPNACPTEKPAATAACSRRSPQVCAYADGGCACVNQAWACYSSTDCPATAPANAGACTFNGMQCGFGDLNCSCSTTNGWTCETPCPATAPAAPTTCTRAANRTCRYDANGAPLNFGGTADKTCTCTNGALNCISQADCPAAVPANASACTALTLRCGYTGGQCTCGADGTWSCVLDCPATTPSNAAACQRPADQFCRYGGGQLASTAGGGAAIDASCSCVDGAFSCSTVADCPATAPANTSACTLSGITCPYQSEGTSCRCRTSVPQWQCTTQTPGGGGAGGGGGSGGAQ